MKTKNVTVAAKEDPEAKARREVDQARAEADQTSALQQVLDRRSRKILRIFGKPAAAGTAASGAAASGSGASGVVGGMSTGAFSGTPSGGTRDARIEALNIKFGSGKGIDQSQFWY